MIIDLYKQKFDGLKYDKLAKVIGDQSPEYNCIAHVLGMMGPGIWPRESETSFYQNDAGFVSFWPNDLGDSETLDNFLKFFYKFKFELCNNDNYEPDYQKIALFCIPGTNKVTHASLMRGNGIWSSKIGYYHVILHQLHSIEGKDYGKVRCFLKRPWTVYKSGLDKTIIDSYWKNSQLKESVYKGYNELLTLTEEIHI